MENSRKKERTEEILIGHKEKFTPIIHEGEGKILIRLLSGAVVEPDTVKSTLKHQRDSGKDKIITQLAVQATFDTLDFFKKYKNVFFIDTNTKVIHEKKISIATIIEVKNLKIEVVKEGKKVNLQKSTPWHFLFENETEIHSEKIAIALLIIKLKKNPHYPEHIGIISDHELGKHAQYNTQKLPLFDAFYLPNGYEIAYASADKKNDSILNRLISECDKCSSQIFDNFERSKKLIIAEREIPLEKILKIFQKTDLPPKSVPVRKLAFAHKREAGAV